MNTFRNSLSRLVLAICIAGPMLFNPTVYAQHAEITNLEGLYLGQKPPGNVPEIFAPGIVSTRMHEHSSPVFSPDGKEMFWSVFFEFRGPQEILYMKQEQGKWTKPEIAPFSGQYMDGNPFFDPSGNRLFFESMRPTHRHDSLKNDLDLWYVDRIGEGWGQPIHLKEINSDQHDRGGSVSADGTLYFSSARENGFGNADIYFSKLEGGQYKHIQNLGKEINSQSYESWPFIAPDQSYILYEIAGPSVTGMEGIYISFPKNKNEWTIPVSLGEEINKSGQNRFPMLSPDGKYLFFGSDRKLDEGPFDRQMSYDEIMRKTNQPGNGWGDIYWVDASFIEKLRPKN